MGWAIAGAVVLLLLLRWRRKRRMRKRVEAGASGDAAAGVLAADAARFGVDRGRKRFTLLRRFDYGSGL